VRELQNTLEYMKATAEGPVLEPRHLPPELRKPGRVKPGARAALHDGQTLSARLLELEAEIIFTVLEECAWNQSAAARRLGVTEGMVRNRIRRYGLKPLARGAGATRRTK
jgi:DNA-binding NtrC family response regulator